MLMAKNALKEPAAVGGDTYVTACSFCGLNLDAAAKKLDSQIPGCAIIDLTDEALGNESKQE